MHHRHSSLSVASDGVQNGENAHFQSSSPRTTRRNNRLSPRHKRHALQQPTQVLCSNLVLLLLVIFGFAMIALNILYIRAQTFPKNKYETLQNNNHTGGQMLRKDRRGRIVHREINKITAQDVGLTDDALPPYNPHLSLQEASVGREFLLDLLTEAGVTDIDNEVLQRLPNRTTIERLYGRGPILYGTDTCQRYRDTIPQHDASLAVAGLFNTGTNLLSTYLQSNCRMPYNKNRNKGMRWQVPWGKHMLASRKWNNTAGKEHKTNKTNVLPVVVVRDPYGWMHSMCRLHYAVYWHHSPAHCPNLSPNQHDYFLYPFQSNHIPVRLHFQDHPLTKYPTIAHLWSDWYRQYYDADYPRIMVRYEDLMYYPKQVVEQLCECAGGVPLNENEFTYMVDSAKWGPGHGANTERTSLVSAMIKYGNVEKRVRGMTRADLELAQVGLDPELMETFSYNQPLLQDR